MNVHFIFYVHLTELFSCWYNCCLFVDCFKVPCRIVDLLLGVKALREGEKLLRDGGGGNRILWPSSFHSMLEAFTAF